MTADLSHLAGRVPDGHGHPAEADRRHQAQVIARHLQLAAKILVEALASGDEGAACRYLHSLRQDPAQPVDPWDLAQTAVTRALRTGAHKH